MTIKIFRCTWDFVNEKPITTATGLDFIINNLVGMQIFIHYIDSSILKRKGIGNDITHDEFTFRDNNVVPIKIETITFTKELLEKYIMVVNDVNKYRNKLVEISNDYNRGFLSLFITYDYTLNRTEIEKIIVAISNGKIKVGDDLYKFVIENNIKISKIPLSKRIKKSILGIINKVLFKREYLEKLKKYDEKLKRNYESSNTNRYVKINNLNDGKTKINQQTDVKQILTNQQIEDFVSNYDYNDIDEQVVHKSR